LILHARATAVSLVLAASLLFAATANAGALVNRAPSCDGQPLSQPFLPWADMASYTPAPGGTAESKGSWTLTRGAGVAQGNEPWNVNSASDKRHLALPAGSSATTDAMCVGIDHPTMRFFARPDSSDPRSALAVDVLFETARGDVTSARIGSIPAAGGWSPSPAFPVMANLLALLPGNHTPVAFRFTPLGSAGWSVDDVYVDPFGRT